MAFKYIVKTKRSGFGDKQAKYYAIPVRTGEISTRELATEISDRCSLTETDVRATLIALSNVMENYLHQGYSIRLDDLGLFSLSATSGAFDLTEACTPKFVKAKKICFKADKRLKENLKFISFERKNEISSFLVMHKETKKRYTKFYKEYGIAPQKKEN